MPKYCPFMSYGGTSGTIDCFEDACGCWDVDKRQCIFLTIGGK